MTQAVQLRKGTTSEHASFTGLQAEPTVDTTKKTIVIHDGSTAGGVPLSREDLSNSNPTNLSAINGADTASSDLFVVYDVSASALKKITRAELNNAIEQDALASVAITGGTINNTAIGGSTAAAGSFTTLTTSSTVTLNGGTANGVLYLNGSKVATSGSALTFDGSNLGVGGASPSVARAGVYADSNGRGVAVFGRSADNGSTVDFYNNAGTTRYGFVYADAGGVEFGATAGLSTKFLANGSEQMRLTSTGLGIGTSSPSSKLQVNGNFRVEGATSEILMATGAERTISASGSASSTALTFKRWNGSSYVNDVVMDGSGNLGLGVTPSAWGGGYKAMTINQGRSIAGTNSGAGDFSLVFNAFYDATDNRWEYEYTGDPATRYSTNSGAHAWYTAPSGTAGNAISFTQAMTLDASGNLLLGETSQAYLSKFTLSYDPTSYNGPIVLDNRAYGIDRGGISWFGGKYNTAGNYRPYGGIGAKKENSTDGNSSGYLSFYTNGNNADATERARIDSSGNLLVGTTTSSGIFTGNAVNTGCVIEGAGGAFARQRNDDAPVYLSKASGYTNGNMILFYVSGSAVGSISVTGSATSYNTSSDYRLKDNQQPLTGSGAFIDALKPKTWNWKVDGSKGVGFIAHEVQEVSPGSVVGEKDGEQMQAMEYGSAEFIANIIAELQSLRQRVALLEGN